MAQPSNIVASDLELGSEIAAWAIAAFREVIRFGGFGSFKPSENRAAASACSRVESNAGRPRCPGPIRSPISVQPRMTLSALLLFEIKQTWRIVPHPVCPVAGQALNRHTEPLG